MANEFARNIKDAELNSSTVALPGVAGTVYSTVLDLGAGAYKGESYELEIVIPDLTTTHLPDAKTLTLNIVAGATTTPTTVIAGAVAVYTGASSAGASGSTIRYRFPSNVARYARVQFVASASSGDMSAVDATVGLRF